MTERNYFSVEPKQLSSSHINRKAIVYFLCIHTILPFEIGKGQLFDLYYPSNFATNILCIC